MSSLTVHNVPDEINQGLIRAFPNEEKRQAIINKKLVSALTELAKESKKQPFYDFLENFEPFVGQEKTAVEMVREARAEEM